MTALSPPPIRGAIGAYGSALASFFEVLSLIFLNWISIGFSHAGQRSFPMLFTSASLLVLTLFLYALPRICRLRTGRSVLSDLNILFYTKERNAESDEIMRKASKGIVHPRNGFPCAIDLAPSYQKMIANSGLLSLSRGSISQEMLEDWAMMQHAVLPAALKAFHAAVVGKPGETLIELLDSAGAILPSLVPPGAVARGVSQVITLLSRYDAFFEREEVSIPDSGVLYNYKREPVRDHLPLHTWAEQAKALGWLTPAERALIL